MRIPNVERIYRRWDEWECTNAGMYEPADSQLQDNHKETYRRFLSDMEWFRSGIARVFCEWPISCENFLTNQSINRIAWIGQSSACIVLSLAACHKGGFWLLSQSQQTSANLLAECNLRKWVINHNANKTTRKRIRENMGEQMLLQWDT